jgi:Fe-S oxidoreductase
MELLEPFANVPWYPLVFPVFYGALAVFGLEMARHLRVFEAARPSHPVGPLGARLVGVARYAVLQTRMYQDPRAALMHSGIFWGFVLLSIGTLNAVTGGLVEAVIGAPLDGALWALTVALQNAIALVVLAAIAVALVRRLVVRPARLTYSLDAIVILLLIGALVAAALLADAFNSAAYGPVPGAFVGNALAGPLEAVFGDASGTLYGVFWWLHIALVAVFLVYLPMSKHLHIATAFPNVFFRKLAPRGELPAMDLEREDVTFGIRTLADVTWKDLLDGLTCTECGRCQNACPAWATGKPLNPKAFIMGIRDMSDEVEHRLPLIPNSPSVRETYGLDDTIGPTDLSTPIVDAAIPYDAVWDCVTCGACVQACPVLIEHVDKIVGLRRNLVLEESRFPTELAPAFRNLESVANPWGQPPAARLDWTKGLPFPVPVAAEVAGAGQIADLEVLYWVGCAAAFDERNRRVARAVVTCLEAAGVRYAVLGQEESCTGDPARRMGNDYVFQLLAAANIETLDRYRAGERTIVTACPHCFNTIGNEYGQLGARYRVVHHSTYLAGLLDEGRLRLVDGVPSRGDGGAGEAPTPVTFHDPCYLARYNGVSRAPREILQALPGVEVREMDRHGRQSFCCGAGGGRFWMEEQRGTRINHERTRQALATGAETIATACPFCTVMMRDGLADLGPDAGAGDKVAARDLAELLADALEPAPGSGGGAFVDERAARPSAG